VATTSATEPHRAPAQLLLCSPPSALRAHRAAIIIHLKHPESHTLLSLPYPSSVSRAAPA